MLRIYVSGNPPQRIKEANGAIADLFKIKDLFILEIIHDDTSR